MNRIFAAVLVAVPVLVASATASAQTAPDSVLTSSLSTLAVEFGDANGHLSFTDDAGNEMFLAYGPSTSPTVYAEGDTISSGEQLLFCVEDATGGLSSCQDAESTALLGSDGLYDCDRGPDGKGVCMCWKNLLPCFHIAATHCPDPDFQCWNGVCFCTGG